MSIRQSARRNSAPTGHILMKFDIWAFIFAYLSRNLKFQSNRTRITGTLHEDQYSYFTISRSIVLRIFATLRTLPRTLGTTLPEIWHKSWSLFNKAKFNNANIDCSQRRDSFQQGILSLTGSSARPHCIVSGLCIAAHNEEFQRSYLARPLHSASSDVPLGWQWNYMLS